MLEQRQHLTSTNCLRGMIFCFTSTPEDPVPREGIFGAHGQLQYTLVCKGRGTPREVKHQWVLARVVSDRLETISGRSGGMAKGHNQAVLCSRLEVSWVLQVGCFLISRCCLGFLDAQQKRGMGKDFCLLKTGVGIQLPAATVVTGLIACSFCVPSLKDFVFCFHSYRN